MDVTRNADGSFTISKPLHGNLMDIFKKKYVGYTGKAAKALFREQFKEAQDKVFINQPVIK